MKWCSVCQGWFPCTGKRWGYYHYVRTFEAVLMWNIELTCGHSANEPT